MYRNYLIQDLTKEKVCANCAYFIQHYVKHGGGYIMCFAGHCVNKRMKPVKPNKACENFKVREEE